MERELDVEVNAGDVEVRLTGIYQDFNYSVQTSAGSIQIGDQEYSGLKKEKHIKNAAAKKEEIWSAIWAALLSIFLMKYDKNHTQ